MVGFFKRRIFRPAYSSVSLGLCFTRLQCGLRAKLGMCRSRKLAVLVQYPHGCELTSWKKGHPYYTRPPRMEDKYSISFPEASAPFYLGHLSLPPGDLQSIPHVSKSLLPNRGTVKDPATAPIGFFSTSISGETGSTSWRINRRQLNFGVIWTDDTSVHQLVGVDQVLQRIHKDPQ